MNANKYYPWHVDYITQVEDVNEENDSDVDETLAKETNILYEWELLSQMGLASIVNINELEMLGR